VQVIGTPMGEETHGETEALEGGEDTEDDIGEAVDFVGV
jgi:hypothetical protein